MAKKIWTNEEVENLMEEKFGDLPLSKAREQAECWIIDHDGILPDENLDEIKKNLKQANKGAKSDKPRAERKPREKDKEKIEIISRIFNFVLDNLDKSAIIVNEVKEISFTIGENDYSLSLIKHRNKK